MQRKAAKLKVLLMCLCLVCTNSSAETTQRSLLLVCSNNLTIEPLAHAEVRKLFLGVPMTKAQVRLRPLLNTSDRFATDVFLQQIVFMSKREYERQLLSRVFRLGDQRPPEYENIDALVKALLDNPGSVSYMWSEQLGRQSGLKSLGILWTDSNN